MPKSTSFMTLYSALGKDVNAFFKYIGTDEQIKTFPTVPFLRRMHFVTSPADVEHVLYSPNKYARDPMVINALRDVQEEDYEKPADTLKLDANVLIESIAEEKEPYYTQAIVQSLERRFAAWNEFVNSNKVFNLEYELTAMAIYFYLDTLLGGMDIDDITDAANLINELFYIISPYTYYLQALGQPWIPFNSTLRHYNDVKRRARKIGKELVERTIAQKDDTKFNFLKYMAKKLGYDINNLTQDQRKHLAGRAFGTLEASTHNLCGILGHLLTIMSRFPYIRERIRAEADSVFGNRLPTHDDYKKLVYTKGAFLETIRLFPGLVSIFRYCIEEDSISGTTINKGDNVWIPAYLCHRLPKYWDNPEGFEPTRFTKPFTPEQEILFLGFSHGLQGCIARKFASLEATLFLSMLVQRFQLDLTPGTSLELDDSTPHYIFSIRLKRDVTMQVKKI